MSKYTPNELQSMAQTALDDKRQGGIDYMFLVMALMSRTGLNEQQVERRIDQLARTGECES